MPNLPQDIVWVAEFICVHETSTLAHPGVSPLEVHHLHFVGNTETKQ